MCRPQCLKIDQTSRIGNFIHHNVVASCCHLIWKTSQTAEFQFRFRNKLATINLKSWKILCFWMYHRYLILYWYQDIIYEMIRISQLLQFFTGKCSGLSFLLIFVKQKKQWRSYNMPLIQLVGGPSIRKSSWMGLSSFTYLNGSQIHKAELTKYIRLHLDKRFKLEHHAKQIAQQIKFKHRQMYGLARLFF